MSSDAPPERAGPHSHRTVRHARRHIAIWALICLLLGAGIFQLRITADYRVFFGPDNPQLVDFQEQEALFFQSDTMLWTVDGDVLEPGTLQALEWLAAEVRGLPHVTRVYSLNNSLHLGTAGDEMTAAVLVPDAAQLTATDIPKLRERIRETGAQGWLISRDERTAALVAQVQLPGAGNIREVPEVILPARNLTAEFRQRWPALELHFFGIVPFNQRLAEVTLRDLWLLFPVSLVLMAGMLIWLLGSLRPALLAGLVVLAGTLIAMGAAGWYGILLTTATAVAPVIVLTLALAHSVHLLTNLQQGLAAGLEQPAALQRSLAMNTQPITLTSCTTIIGFLSLNFSDAPPFRELGNMVALGVLASWAAALWLLPALVTVIGCDRRQRPPNAFWTRLGGLVARQHRPVIAVALLCLLPVLGLIPLNSVNDVFREWFAPSDPLRRGIDHGINKLGGVEELHYTLDSGRPDGVVDPAFTAQTAAFENWLNEQPEVVHTQSHLQALKRLHRVLREDLPEQETLPQTAAMGRQLLSILELSQTADGGVNHLLDLDKRRLRLSLRLRPMTSSQLKAFDLRARDWLAQHAPAIQTRQGSGALMMFAELGQRNIRQLVLGAVLALGVISLILILALRSVSLGLISLVPNLLPTAAGFGLWGLVSAEVNIAIAVVMGMTLGIVVDDTIHFLSKYNRLRAQQHPAQRAVELAFADVGYALWVTTVVLVAGFAVLALSNFSPTADMGLLTALILLLAVVLDLSLLPALLIAADRLFCRAGDTRN